MYKLRQTWTPLIPNAKLYGIDVKIQSNLDPAWPVTATAPEQTIIHVNPNFLRKVGLHHLGLLLAQAYKTNTFLCDVEVDNQI